MREYGRIAHTPTALRRLARKLGQAVERGRVEKAAHWVGFED